MTTNRGAKLRFNILALVRAGSCVGLGLLAARRITALPIVGSNELARLLVGALVATAVAALATVVFEGNGSADRDTREPIA